MESSLLLLSSLLRATISSHGASDRPALVFATDPTLLLADLVSPELLATISATLREIAEGRMPAEQAIPRMRQLAASLDRILSSEPAHLEQAQTLARQLQIVATINRAATSEQSALTHVSINLAESKLADLVREWHIGATAAEPATIVICMPPGSSSGHSVRLRGSTYVERRVTLHYSARPTYPHLGLRSLAATALDARPKAHRDWRQLPLADYDLTIFTEQERLKGHILTRRALAPLMVRGAVFTLTLAGPSSSQITITEFRDECERPLVRILLWPPVDSSPSAP